jgi:hypothetical protein
MGGGAKSAYKVDVVEVSTLVNGTVDAKSRKVKSGDNFPSLRKAGTDHKSL